MRREARTAGVVCAAALLLAVVGCIPRPAILQPAHGTTTALDGTTDVRILLDAPLDPGGSLRVSLLSGIDAPPGSVADVTSRISVIGDEATGQLDAQDLVPGRNTLFVSIDADGDGTPENVVTSTFRWDPLRAAACKRVITPVVGQNHSDPIYLAGFGNDRRATGVVHDDLWARGFVLENAQYKMAFVTLDVVGYFYNEVETIRADPALAGLGFDSITVTSTHNHEGPDTMGIWGEDQVTSGVDLGYLDFVNQQVVDCIVEAAANTVPAEMRFATGTTVGASLPPEPNLVSDGKVLADKVIPGNLMLPAQPDPVIVHGDPGQFTNPSVPTLQIRDRLSGDVLSTVVNYASHPESLGSQEVITSDFPHYMREALEARYGGTAVYVSADLGVLQGPLWLDVEDPDTGQPAPRRSFRFAEVMGELLADRAAQALDAVPTWDPNPTLDVRSSGVVQVLVESILFQAAGQFGIFGRRPLVLNADNALVAESEVQVLRIGPAQLAVTPNELDPQIGDVYRALMTEADHRWIVGLGNDELGYQMPEAKWDPSCFNCMFYLLLFESYDSCPIYQAGLMDCSTVFENNIGPSADPLLQSVMTPMLEDLN